MNLRHIDFRTNRVLWFSISLALFVGCWFVPLFPYFKGNDAPTVALLRPDWVGPYFPVLLVLCAWFVGIALVCGWVLQAVIVIGWRLRRNGFRTAEQSAAPLPRAPQTGHSDGAR